jgi:hypothetical protein
MRHITNDDSKETEGVKYASHNDDSKETEEVMYASHHG